MSRYISEKYRKIVAERAKHCCEYCLISQEDSFFTFEVDHIISLKHGGSSNPENLAYSCLFCNRSKGSDIGSVLLPQMAFLRLYNPRLDDWSAHFQLVGPNINPLTQIGEVSVKILELNHVNRLIERQILIDIGRYPNLL